MSSLPRPPTKNLLTCVWFFLSLSTSFSFRSSTISFDKFIQWSQLLWLAPRCFARLSSVNIVWFSDLFSTLRGRPPRWLAQFLPHSQMCCPHVVWCLTPLISCVRYNCLHLWKVLSLCVIKFTSWKWLSSISTTTYNSDHMNSPSYRLRQYTFLAVMLFHQHFGSLLLWHLQLRCLDAWLHCDTFLSAIALRDVWPCSSLYVHKIHILQLGSLPPALLFARARASHCPHVHHCRLRLI